MKKTLAYLLALFTLLSLAACGAPQTPASEMPAVEIVDETAQPEGNESTAAEIPAVEETDAAPTVSETAQPEETTETGGEFVALTAAQQEAVNLCMSNFSEQHFCELDPFDHYDAGDTSIAQLFQFAHLWAKINRPSALSYSGDYETMTREVFYDIVSPRLAFSQSLAPVEGEDYSAEFGIGHYDWDHCWYENGLFYYPAGDGESYPCFSVVDEAYRFDDGRWRFRFTIYELDLDIYWDNNGIPSVYYQLTPAQAAQRAANGEITARHTGTADCTTVYWESSRREMYQLEHYELDPLD